MNMKTEAPNSIQKRALIAMSGGVDSSVAALLVKEAGYDCCGITLKLFYNEDIGLSRLHTCCSLEDVEDARGVAHALQMLHYTFNFSWEFKRDVIEKFVESYVAGLVPNPCIDCNRYIKFEKLLLRAKQLDYAYVATGHYAQIEYDDTIGRFLLKKAVDLSKDQSYVLYTLTQDQLGHMLFPLGKMSKKEVRALAESHGLRTAEKPDSQDICFVQNGSYADFIERYSGETSPPGQILNDSGNCIGTHQGLIRYTIGQRKGLGLSTETPYYVHSKDILNNSLTVCARDQLLQSTVFVHQLNWIAIDRLISPMRIKAKCRYGQEEQWARAFPVEEDLIRVEFELPQWAVAEGQALVMYDHDIVVGGGTITSASVQVRLHQR